MRVSLAQLDSQDDVTANLDAVADFVMQAAAAGSELILLPESFAYRGPFAREFVEPTAGIVLGRLRALAAQQRIAISAGGLWTAGPDPDHPYNSSLLINASGEIIADYRKIHLFRLDEPGADRVDEADFTTPGDQLVVADLGPARLGLSICYDLRFPELYRALGGAGATVLCVPSNFSEYTGRAHWETLLRARAIENLAFVLAPAQCGTDTTNFAAHGHTLAVDPWGGVLARAGTTPELITLDLPLADVDRYRAQLHVLRHGRPDAYRQPVQTGLVDA
jgi:deaminated glutathione amidase